MNTKYLQQVKQAALKALLPKDRPGNVVGVGIGEKQVNGQPAAYLRVYVISKLAPNHLSPAELVPLMFEDVPTDVIEIDRFGRNGHTLQLNLDPKADPTPKPGSSIRVKTNAANVNSGATGTLGMVVSYADQRYILGCNHILSVNGRVQADPKAEIVSAVFVGDEPTIAYPEPKGYVPLNRNGENIADCALARINGQNKVSAAFPAAFGNPKPSPRDPQLRMRVKKLGAATGTKEGTIVDADVDLDVDYDFGTFRFQSQILIEGDRDDFAAAGDSGSIVVDEQSQQPVGMIFAASGKYAVACPLSGVLKALQLRLGNGKVPLELHVS